jgi:hypothetical protein
VKFNLDILLYGLMLIAFGGTLFLARDWPIDAAIFPLLIGTVGLLLAFTGVISCLYRGKNAGGSPSASNRVTMRRELVTFGWILGFFASVALLGFQWGLPAASLLYLRFEGHISLAASTLLSFICWGFLYAMGVILHLPLYEGFILIRWL